MNSICVKYNKTNKTQPYDLQYLFTSSIYYSNILQVYVGMLTLRFSFFIIIANCTNTSNLPKADMKNKNSLNVATHFTPRIKLFMRQLLLDIPLRSFIRCSLFSFHFVVIGLILLCRLVLATSFARECPYVYLYDVYMNMENIGNTTKKTEFYFVTKTTFTPTFIHNNTKNNFKTFIDEFSAFSNTA